MKLALFFTRNVSLKLWLDSGLFDREKRIYQEHLNNGDLQKVYWLTYGSADTEIAERLRSDNRLHHDIEILSMPCFFYGSFGRLIYSFLMPLVYRRVLKSIDILKTNQVDGSWSAVITKRLYKKPLIARSGYTLSLLAQKKNRSKLKIKLAEWIERFLYKYADIAVVTSSQDSRYIQSKYNVSRVKVLYNYIDTELFRPIKCEKYTDRIVFVGRLAPVKNIFNLIEALSETGFTLDIYGDGQLREQLASKAKDLKIDLNFMGIVANDELPEILSRYHYFILPSLYEGMPKSLLEAMACGLVCIGTDVEGINEIIEDRINGFLANGTSTEALAKAIKTATQLPTETIIKEAVQKIRDNFSVPIITEKEKRILTALEK